MPSRQAPKQEHQTPVGHPTSMRQECSRSWRSVHRSEDCSVADWHRDPRTEGQPKLRTVSLLRRAKVKQDKHAEVLRHSVRLCGPGIESVGVNGELLLDRSERLEIDKEKNLSRIISYPFIDILHAFVSQWASIPFRKQREKH